MSLNVFDAKSRLKYARRLIILCEFLEKLKPGRFNFGTWMTDKSGNTFRTPEAVTHPDVNVCGTVACAAGWGTCLPFAKKDGLHLRYCDFGAAGLWDIDGHLDEVFGFEDIFYPSFSVLGCDATAKEWAKHVRKNVVEAILGYKSNSKRGHMVPVKGFVPSEPSIH